MFLSEQTLALEVLDRSKGIPEDEREQIFKRFYQPAGHREGQGG